MFKADQKVRIKGTDITGTVYKDGPDRDGIVNVEGPGREADYYVPAELVEAIVEPITVTFDPVDPPYNTTSQGGTYVRVLRNEFCPSIPVDIVVGGRMTSWRVEQARKLAYAILTITEAQNNG